MECKKVTENIFSKSWPALVHRVTISREGHFQEIPGLPYLSFIDNLYSKQVYQLFTLMISNPPKTKIIIRNVEHAMHINKGKQV